MLTDLTEWHSGQKLHWRSLVWTFRLKKILIISLPDYLDIQNTILFQIAEKSDSKCYRREWLYAGHLPEQWNLLWPRRKLCLRMSRRIPWQELSSCSSTAARTLPYTGIACISISHTRTMPNMSHSRTMPNMSHPGTMPIVSHSRIMPNMSHPRTMPNSGTMSHYGAGSEPLCWVSLYEWRDVRKHSRWELHVCLQNTMDWCQLRKWLVLMLFIWLKTNHQSIFIPTRELPLRL